MLVRSRLFFGAVIATALATSAMTAAFAADITEENVTFEDVLAAPNDIPTSVAWAKRQIKENRLEQAAATLERVVLLAPNSDEVRLLYGVLLYRLGNLTEARAELDLLQGRDLSVEDAASRDSYLALIDEADRRFTFEATIGLGAHYDSNRNFSPEDGIAFFNNTAFNLNAGEQDDRGILAFLSIGGAYDPKSEYVDRYYARVVGLQDQQFEVDALDLQGVAAVVGVEGGYEAFRLEGFVGADHIRFDQNSVVDVYKAEVLAELPLKNPAGVTPFVDARIAYEDFYDPRNGRSGPRYEVGVGVSALIEPNVKLTGRISLDIKDAEDAFEDFIAPQFEAELLHALPGGQAIVTDFSIRHERYAKADPAVANINRRDDEIEFGVKYIAALDRLFKHWDIEVNEDIVRDMRFSAGASYSRNSSNVANFDFNNARLESLVTKTFKF